MDICKLTALQLAEKIKKKEISTIEAVEAVFSRIEEQENLLHSFLYFKKEDVLKQAEEIQKKINKQECSSLLAGVPAVFKDNLCVKGMPVTCGSKMLEHFMPSYEAFAVSALRKSGVICLGKTNMDEFAMGSTTETSAFGITRNPLNLQYVAGGSSGGSGAAVAAEECFFALGTDTGGSVRQPAAYCGIVGLKPTYGSVSRYGLIAYGSSLEQIGPMTKNVKDCAAVFQAIHQQDKQDFTSVAGNKTDYVNAITGNIKGKRIGVPKEFLEEGLENEIKQAIQHSLSIWEKQGAIIEECSLSYTKYFVPVYYTIASAEASSNLERYDGVKYGFSSPQNNQKLHSWYRQNRSQGFGPEVKRRIMLGTFVLSAGYYEDYYLQSCKVRQLIKQEFDSLLQKYDVIVSPVSPTTAPKIGESLKDPLQMYLSDLYTIPANLTGMPAISLPCGKDSKGLPIGIQLMSNYHREDILFDFGYVLETN